MEESLKEKTAKGLMWGGMSNGLIQLLGALFGIVLLRLLTPSDYGKIAVLVIFSNIANNLQESGFIAALANKKNPTDADYNGVFWFNIIVSSVLYVILFACSPLIARFYHEPILTDLARFLFLGFVISAFGTVQRAYLFGHLLVKQSSIINITALIVSNVIGIAMAYCGYAYWGLATQTIVYTMVVAGMSWMYSPWRPSLNPDIRPALKMFGFSSKLLLTYIFNQLNSQVFAILLGRFYNTKVAGNYSNARKWDDMCILTISGMVQGVAQPVLAQVREDDARYCNVFRKMLRFVSFVSFPCMLGMGLIAREFILITVGEAWLESAMILSLLSIYGAFYPITVLYSNMTISRGKSNINMFCTITLCVLVWIGLISMSSLGLYPMITYFIVLNVLWLLVWQWFAWRLTGLSFSCMIRDVMPFFLVAVAVMAGTWYVTRGIENIYLLIVAKVVIAAVLYLGIIYLSGAAIMRESMEYVFKRRVTEEKDN